MSFRNKSVIIRFSERDFSSFRSHCASLASLIGS